MSETLAPFLKSYSETLPTHGLVKNDMFSLINSTIIYAC